MNDQSPGSGDPDGGAPPGWHPQPGPPGPAQPGPAQPGPGQPSWGPHLHPPQYAWGPPPTTPNPPKSGVPKGCLIALAVFGVITILGVATVVAGMLFLAGKTEEITRQSSPGAEKLPQEIDGLKLVTGGVTGLACSLSDGMFDAAPDTGKIGSYCYSTDHGDAFAMALAGKGEVYGTVGSMMLSGAGDGAEPKDVNGARCGRDTAATVICVASRGDVTALVITSAGVSENTAAKIAVSVAERVG